jgi:hypothetical protein
MSYIPGLGLTEPHLELVSVTPSSGVKRSVHVADHSAPYSAEVNKWNNKSTGYVRMAWYLVTLQEEGRDNETVSS